MSTELTSLSNQLADAVQAAGAWTVRVQARRGPAATGIALAADLVLTADHVVDPSREDAIRIGLPDGSEVGGSVVGRDPATDLAILRIASGIATPATAAAREPRTGALALVVGRPGSAAERQPGHDHRHWPVQRAPGAAACSSASSGRCGDVPGLFGRPTPRHRWRRAGHDHQRPRLRRTRRGHALVARRRRSPRRIEQARQGAARLSRRWQPTSDPVAAGQGPGWRPGARPAGRPGRDGGPAATGGVLQGDILVKLDGNAISNADDLQGLLGPNRVGTSVTASVVRGGELREVSVTVGSRD